MRVLVACEFSGIVRDAFRKRGHDAWSCDLLPTERPGPHIQGDVLKHLMDGQQKYAMIPCWRPANERTEFTVSGWDLMIAHPPCTYLTVTGNKWMKAEFRDRFPDRQRQRDEAIEFFLALWNAPIERICIENPVGIMSTIFRKPDQYIQPYEFGHPESKKTCLWLRNLPPLEKDPSLLVEPEWMVFKSGKRMSRVYAEMARSKNRGYLRSITYQGIADAMAEQWGG